jgi:PD-(D/E)XK nuclease superfamily/Domain of unknown function (DUF2357)
MRMAPHLELSISPSTTAVLEPLSVCGPGGHLSGLVEDTDYVLRLSGLTAISAHIDDIELQRCASNEGYSWRTEFYAGTVEISVLDAECHTYIFTAEVLPVNRKIGNDEFQSMVSDIYSFDADLLIGTAAATQGFGVESAAATLNLFVSLARIRLHGLGFLGQIEKLLNVPHRHLKPSARRIPVSKIRVLPASAAKDARLAAIAHAGVDTEDELDSIQLLCLLPEMSTDTAANQTLKALLLRFRARVMALIRIVEQSELGQERTEQNRRMKYRLALLSGLKARASTLLSQSLFSSISRAETSAAGLTHIAANPSYNLAYRRGTSSLRTGVYGNDRRDNLNVSPTWGVYETWCYVRLCKALQVELQIVEWLPTRFASASAQVAFYTMLKSGARLELLFQADFPSESPSNSRLAWSISKKRIPDIVLVWRLEEQCKFYVLDAKYRSGVSNTFDAMESAHIYRDSLRMGVARPDQVHLLMPGPTSVKSIEDEEYWKKNQVGTISLFAPGGNGIAKCMSRLREWLLAHPNEHIASCKFG